MTATLDGRVTSEKIPVSAYSTSDEASCDEPVRVSSVARGSRAVAELAGIAFRWLPEALQGFGLEMGQHAGDGSGRRSRATTARA